MQAFSVAPAKAGESRPTFLRLNDRRAILVADLRPIQTTVAVADTGGRFISQESFETPSDPQKKVAASPSGGNPQTVPFGGLTYEAAQTAGFFDFSSVLPAGVNIYDPRTGEADGTNRPIKELVSPKGHARYPRLLASQAMAASEPRPGRGRAMFTELSNYLDEHLDDSLCAELEKHLDGREPCKEFLSSLQATIEQCRKSRAERPNSKRAAKLRKEIVTHHSRIASIHA